MKYGGLTPILEEDHGFQLVLHQRDFIPGTPIITNIATFVVETRRMIMLLSRYFLYCPSPPLKWTLTPTNSLKIGNCLERFVS